MPKPAGGSSRSCGDGAIEELGGPAVTETRMVSCAAGCAVGAACAVAARSDRVSDCVPAGVGRESISGTAYVYSSASAWMLASIRSSTDASIGRRAESSCASAAAAASRASFFDLEAVLWACAGDSSRDASSAIKHGRNSDMDFVTKDSCRSVQDAAADVHPGLIALLGRKPRQEELPSSASHLLHLQRV